MLKFIAIALFPLLSFSGSSDLILLSQNTAPTRNSSDGVMEKMIVSSGSVRIGLDPGFPGVAKKEQAAIDFGAERMSFFTALVFNGSLRAMLPSSMTMNSKNITGISKDLATQLDAITLENTQWGSDHDLVVRDAKGGQVIFNVEGHEPSYDPDLHQLSFDDGRLVITPEFAKQLGRTDLAGRIVGTISLSATMQPIEVIQISGGEVKSDEMPPVPQTGTNPGPDVIVGDLSGLAQFGSAVGTQVGLAVGTDSCNLGVENLHWWATPDNDHPVIPQNLYRMSGGTSNTDRFEQIGQSNVKHAFLALADNICNLGCNGVSGSNLGSGCSDPYSANLNSGPSLGSRAWINPFTGAYPRGDSLTPPNNHSGHSHTSTSHRILTEVSDLSTTQNPGATYYAESQYVTPHEYAWCQTHPGQCNMFNNASYRQYTVSGTSSPFSFSPAGSTVRMKPAIAAWTGATTVPFEPSPGADGMGIVGYKVTNPSPGVWHYEYAVYNQNLDRAIQSFSIPVGAGATVSNTGFHAPPQQPGWPNDGTVGNAGYSSTPWPSVVDASSVSWSTETFAANQNANAIRWGTLYNFRFDSNRPPQDVQATIGFFKTGDPITVTVPGPTSAAAVSISGRVVSSNGTGVHGATVTITNGTTTRRLLTGTFGYFRFDGIMPGSYTVSAKARQYTFASQELSVSSNVADLVFSPE